MSQEDASHKQNKHLPPSEPIDVYKNNDSNYTAGNQDAHDHDTHLEQNTAPRLSLIHI